MFVTGDSIVYSASDLAAAARCQYALLREFDAKLGRGPAVAVDDELMARAAVLGSAHEGRRLDQLRHEFGDAVAIIGRPAYTPAGVIPGIGAFTPGMDGVSAGASGSRVAATSTRSAMRGPKSDAIANAPSMCSVCGFGTISTVPGSPARRPIPIR